LHQRLLLQGVRHGIFRHDRYCARSGGRR
jgi:hypothetical protein